MKTIFLDDDFKCYTSNNSAVKEIIETDIFDGKCDAYIEGYRFIPAGETWQRKDGAVFPGEMVAPWKPYGELAAAQEQYELMMSEAEAAYREGVNDVD